MDETQETHARLPPASLVDGMNVWDCPDALFASLASSTSPDEAIKCTDKALALMASQSLELTVLVSNLEQEFRSIPKSVISETSVRSQNEQQAPSTFGECHYALKFSKFPSMPLYTKRRYDFEVRIHPKNSTVPPINYPFFCHSSPYFRHMSVRQMTPDLPEVPLVSNGTVHAGRKLLKGETTRICRTGSVLSFEGISFRDVSRRFPQGRAILKIECIGRQGIRSLLFEGLRIKVRKRLPNEVI